MQLLRLGRQPAIYLRSQDLRFRKTGCEVAFKAHLEKQVLRSGIVLIVAGWGIFGASLVNSYNRTGFRDDGPFRWDLEDPRAVRLFIMIFSAGVSAILTILIMFRLRYGFFRTWAWERIFLGFAVYAMISYFLANRWYFLELWGMQPDSILISSSTAYTSELLLVLNMIVTLAGVCLYCPIRSCILWILPACVVCILVAARTLEWPESESSFQVPIPVMMLCFFAYIGAHRHEQHMRQEWRAVQQVQEAQVEIQESQDHLVPLPAESPGVVPTVFGSRRSRTTSHHQGNSIHRRDRLGTPAKTSGLALPDGRSSDTSGDSNSSDNGSSNSGSSKSSSRSRGRPPQPDSGTPTWTMVSSFEPTSPSARAQAIAEAMSSWNLLVDAKSCCALHVGIAAAQEVLRKLNKKGCCPLRLCRRQCWQCPQCTCLADCDRDRCRNCFAERPRAAVLAWQEAKGFATPVSSDAVVDADEAPSDTVIRNSTHDSNSTNRPPAFSPIAPATGQGPIAEQEAMVPSMAATLHGNVVVL